MLVYEAGPITVRELEEKDEISLASWLSNPDVLQYYEGRDNPHDVERVREHFTWMMMRLAASLSMRETDRIYSVLSSG